MINRQGDSDVFDGSGRDILGFRQSPVAVSVHLDGGDGIDDLLGGDGAAVCLMGEYHTGCETTQ